MQNSSPGERRGETAVIINVVTEPLYTNSVWCRQIVKGITARASKLRYDLNFLEESHEVEHEIGIVCGTSPDWITAAVDDFGKRDIHAIVVNCPAEPIHFNTSYVLLDYELAMTESLAYLRQCGKKRTALYGINQNSYTDNLKVKFFPPRDIIYNNGNLKESFFSLMNVLQHYDSIICSNYISGVSLARLLKEEGVRIPEDIYFISFGNSLLGGLTEPSLTTVEQDFYQLGEQTVLLFAFLAKQKNKVSLTAKIPCRIRVDSSTGYQEYRPEYTSTRSAIKGESFYNDPVVDSVMKIESLLMKCDKTDYRILCGLYENIPYPQLSERVFVTENTLKYRVKRMMGICGVKSKEELSTLLFGYLHIEKLKKLCAKE